MTDSGKRFTELLDQTATKEDVAALFKKLIKFITELKETLVEKYQTDAAELKRLVEEYETRFKATESSLTERQAADKTSMSDTMYSESRTLQRLLQQEVARVESLIEYYDDNEVRSLIEDTKRAVPQMPKEFDPSTILKELEAIKNRIEELDTNTKQIASRATGTIGGVSNLRIQQAFKYILKTEAPVGAIDGVNLTYTLSQPIFAILSMSINGETIAQLPNYTIKGKTFTFSTALPAAYSTKDWEVKYI